MRSLQNGTTGDPRSIVSIAKPLSNSTNSRSCSWESGTKIKRFISSSATDGHTWLETLEIASTTAPTDSAEAKSWQDRLLTDSKSVPFPVAYETHEDLTWSKNSKGRLEVHSNGLGEHTFQIYCDQRQLKWFQRFYEDQEIKRASID